MKPISKKITMMLLAFTSLACMAFGGATAVQSSTAQADSTLEEEFTSNGQFAVGYYTGSAAYSYEFVDGSAESLPAGYNGSVLKISSQATNGVPYVNIDFTASKISASMVESVVVRVYSPDYRLTG